jgi:hypothetical protein
MEIDIFFCFYFVWNQFFGKVPHFSFINYEKIEYKKKNEFIDNQID